MRMCVGCGGFPPASLLRRQRGPCRGRRGRRRRPCGPGRERLLGLERCRDLEPLGRAAHAADRPELVFAGLEPPQEPLLPSPSLCALVEHARGSYGDNRGLLLPQCAGRRGKGHGGRNEDSDSASDVEHAPSYRKGAAESTPVSIRLGRERSYRPAARASGAAATDGSAFPTKWAR
jgi:hypothetical protein